MSLFAIIIALAVVGVVLWLINSYVPMPPRWKTIINVIALVVVILWLLKVFGLWSHINTIRI